MIITAWLAELLKNHIILFNKPIPNNPIFIRDFVIINVFKGPKDAFDKKKWS